MKRLFTLTLTLCIMVASFAQSTSNLIVFSADGDPFYLILNGIKQNTEPETNVKVTGINEGAYRIKIQFHDENMADLDKDWLINPGVEATAMIENKKGKYKLKYRGEIPISDATTTSTDQTEYIFTTTQPAATTVTTDAVVNETTTTTTTTTTVTENDGNGENVSMDVNMGGMNFSMDVNVDDATMNGENSTTTTTTTYTTTTDATTTDATTNNNTQVVNNTTTRSGCSYPKSTSEFNEAKAAVEAEDFGDDMLMVAKQMTKNSCLTVDQVKEITNLFDFSDEKLEYAKFAYDYTYDPENYYKVNDCFEFSDDKEALIDYLNSK